MLRLAGEVSDGAWVNFLPLSAVEQVVGEVRAGEQAAGREPGSVDIVCRFFNVPAPPEEGLPFVRFMFAAYATVPVYAEYFRWLGFADQIDPMVEAWRAATASARSSSCPRTSRATCSCSAGPTSSASGSPPSPPRASPRCA